MTEVLDEQSLRAEILALRSDLSGALTAGLTAVNSTLSQLAEQHHQSILEQTKQNVSFASRERVDSLAAAVATNTRRLEAIESNHLELKTSLSAINQTLQGLSTQLGDLAGRKLDEPQFQWVKQGEARARAHAETRAQMVKQLFSYLMIAIAGILISGLGIAQIVGALLGHR